MDRYQAYAYYALAVLVLSVMAVRGYVIFESQSVLWTVLAISLPFLIVAALRHPLQRVFVDSSPSLEQPKRQLTFDLGLYIAAAAALFIYESVLNNHPYFIAGKAFVTVLVIGYFASMDSALNRERKCFLNPDLPRHISVPTVPTSRRLSLFLTITVLIILLAHSLSAYTYMSMNLGPARFSIEELKRAYLVETLFTLGIVVSLTLRLIHSYSLNLQHLFDTQVGALRHIRDGHLDDYVPVLSRDEFGVIAEQTNAVIDELREKEKIRQTLAQIVSPDIVDRLLCTDSGSLAQSEERLVAVLFCDLRKFTSYAENTAPEDVIFFLNAYFSKIVDIVYEHNGIVNKFMGDAVLAVFPLEEGTATIDNAVDAAWDILMHSQAIRMPDGRSFDVGVGLHMGRAAAGTIGSSDRYEYTFIGDTVNTASRLDGLSKRLGYHIIVSDEVYRNLGVDSQERFADLGLQRLRGKKTLVHVYGAAAQDEA